MTHSPSLFRSPARATRRSLMAGLVALAAMPRSARALSIEESAGSAQEGTLRQGLGASQQPSRIASLGGAVTEILYRLGASDRIVAVDTTSVYPAQAMREKPNVGYLRALSAEGILSTRPDLVIATEGAGPPDVLGLLKEAGVPVSLIREPPTPEGVLDKIVTVGRLVGLGAGADALAKEVEAHFAELSRARARIARPAKALVVMSLANGRVMVGGRASTADGILTLAGVENAASGIEGFKPISDEAIIAAAPDSIVMMSNRQTGGQAGGQAGGHDAPELDRVFAPGTALGQTPAAARRSLVAMDGLYLLGFGPRTPEAGTDLMRAIYPDLFRG